MTADGLALAEAIEAVRAGCIFTTHTPVPAGIDRFPRELMEKYFAGWCAEVGITVDDLMELGHRLDEAPDERFNMAVMGLRLAGRSNAVAKLHGAVSRDMFADLWPDVPTTETPIVSITNGVHAQSWTSPEVAELLTSYVLPEWAEADEERWARIADARDDEVWRAREQGRERLVAFVRQRLRTAALARGLSSVRVTWTDEVLDPKALTIGFARRFATYKRATLLLSQPDRLQAAAALRRPSGAAGLLGQGAPGRRQGQGDDPPDRTRSRPTPRCGTGSCSSTTTTSRSRAHLLQGCDVWLNNPRRPQEACGTSGMKAALNGALNLSILDGWWDEMFNGENGWAISSAEHLEDLERRDEVEANSLFELLEHQVVPLFYERWEGPVPRRWVRRVKDSLGSLGHQVIAARMVRDYTQELYEPTAARAAALGADGFAAPRHSPRGRSGCSTRGTACTSTASTPSRAWRRWGPTARSRPSSRSARSPPTMSRCS